MHSIIEHADLHFSYHYITKPGDSPILKKAANFTPVSPNRRDRRTPVKLSRSNEATSQVTKGYSAHASLTNEVLPVRFRHTLKKKRRTFPGQMKRQAGLPKVNPCIRRLSVWQMKSYSCYLGLEITWWIVIFIRS